MYEYNVLKNDFLLWFEHIRIADHLQVPFLSRLVRSLGLLWTQVMMFAMLCIKPLTWDTAGKLSFESNHVSFVSFSFFSRLIFSSIKCLLYKALLACFQCKALNESIENQFLEEEIHTIVFFNIYLLLSCCITTNIRIFHQHNNEMPFLTHTMLVNTDIIFTTDQNHSI